MSKQIPEKLFEFRETLRKLIDKLLLKGGRVAQCILALNQAALGLNLGSDVIINLEIFFSRGLTHYCLVHGQYRDRTHLVLIQGISEMQCSEGLSQAIQKTSTHNGQKHSPRYKERPIDNFSQKKVHFKFTYLPILSNATWVFIWDLNVSERNVRLAAVPHYRADHCKKCKRESTFRGI